MSSVYLLTLRQLSGRWRLLIMLVLSTLPMLIAALMLSSKAAPSMVDFESAILSAMLAGSIGPLVVLAIAAAAFANEVEDRTLANLTLAPIPRWQIVVPKLFATITIAAPFLLMSAFVTSYIAYLGDARATMAVTVSTLVAVVLYSSVFLWLGLVSTQAIGLGLVYIVLWEGFFSQFVSGVRVLSIRYFSIGIMHGLDERRFAWTNHLSLTTAVVILVVALAGFLYLTIRRLRRMDVP